MTSNSKTHPIFEMKTPWQEDGSNIWLSSTLGLSRNIVDYKFPGKLEKQREQQVISLLYEALKKSPELKKPLLFPSENLSPIEKEFLLEHFLVSDGFNKAHSGEGFVIDDSGSFLAVINLENHLQLLLTDTTQELEKSWNRLSKIEESIGKSVDFSFNPRFGFLSSNPEKSGTGLTISIYLHLPAIIHMGELPELLEKEKEDEITVMGLQGSPSEMAGDLLIAQNNCTLGLSEEYLLTSLRMWATRAVVAEVTLRKKLKENGPEHLKNKVARALGLLTHAYQLEVIEALNALSLLKLGLDLGWVTAKEKLNLTEIYFNVRRAHLLHLLDQKANIPELPRKRAEYLQRIAGLLTLSI